MQLPYRKANVDLHVPVFADISVNIKNRPFVKLIPCSGKPTAKHFLIDHEQKLWKAFEMVYRILAAFKRMRKQSRCVLQGWMIPCDGLAQFKHTAVFIGNGGIIDGTLDVKRMNIPNAVPTTISG